MASWTEGRRDAAVCRLGTDESLGKSVGSGRDVHCAFCTAVLLDKTVRCSGCGDLFHAHEACCGVGNRIIYCLLTEKCGALQYFCCRCRVRVDGRRDACGAAGASSLDWLLKIVAVLSRRESEMAGKLEAISHRCERAGEQAVGGLSRESVQIELRELQERERRQNSIVLRGCQTDNDRLLRRKLDVCLFLDVGTVEFSDFVNIGNTGLFRAKIRDREQRMVLLNNVMRLKNSEQYRFLYIQHDLTYRQRQDMIARRNALAACGDQSVGQERGTLAVRSFSSVATVHRGALRGRRGASLMGVCGAGHGVSLGSGVSSSGCGLLGVG